MHYLRKYFYDVTFIWFFRKLVEHTFPKKKIIPENINVLSNLLWSSNENAAKFHDLFKTSINFDNLEDMRTHSIKSAIEYSKIQKIYF